MLRIVTNNLCRSAASVKIRGSYFSNLQKVLDLDLHSAYSSAVSVLAPMVTLKQTTPPLNNL